MNTMDFRAVSETLSANTNHNWFPAAGEIAIPAGATFDLAFSFYSNRNGALDFQFESDEQIEYCMCSAIAYKFGAPSTASEYLANTFLGNTLDLGTSSSAVISMLRLRGVNKQASSNQIIRLNPDVTLGASQTLTYTLLVDYAIRGA
jgi:hypothetical protein